MRKFFLFSLIVLLFTSCLGPDTANYFLYNKDKMNGLDFSKGKWLIGEIEVNPYARTNLTNLVLDDFNEYLGDRVKYSVNERSLLLPKQIPVHPTKSVILDLKKGADFDYFINIKCKTSINDLSNFEFIDHYYYKKRMSYAQVILEVYDLNTGEIIYSQASGGSIEKVNTTTNKPTTIITIGSYKAIINDIKKKSIKPLQ